MSTDKKTTISVQGSAITILSQREEDYISLTDMAKKFGDDSLIYSWMRNRNSLEFLGIWEQIHNPGFKGGEFETFKKEAGLNSFHLTPRKWVEATAAVGIQSRAGRYGGTYAHKDLAFEFGSWLSPEFKLYLIKEFQRLKDDENSRLSLAWNLNRTLSKLNYRIHTDAIKAHLIPAAITPEQARITYANEADVLNVAMFGQTAKAWRDAHPQGGWQHARRGRDRATAGARQSGKPQRRIHPHGTDAGRTLAKAQRHRHPPVAEPEREFCPASFERTRCGVGRMNAGHNLQKNRGNATLGKLQTKLGARAWN